MLDKLKLNFCLSSDLETAETEEEAARYFDKVRREALEGFASGLNLSSDEAALLAKARKYLETPAIFHALFEPRAHKALANLAQNNIPRLFEAIDGAAFECTKEDVAPAAAFILSKRLERLRAELEIWRDAIRNGNFEVYQTRPLEKMPEHFERFPAFEKIYRPNLHGHFPARSFNVPWQPAAAKVKQEPEEFRQIWLNPEEDIPFVLEALKRLEFIDENEVWRWNKLTDCPGGVIDAILRQKKTRLITSNYLELNKVFGRRFKFPDPEKRFERGKGTYDKSFQKMDNYLKNNK